MVRVAILRRSDELDEPEDRLFCCEEAAAPEDFLFAEPEAAGAAAAAAAGAAAAELEEELEELEELEEPPPKFQEPPTTFTQGSNLSMPVFPGSN